MKVHYPKLYNMAHLLAVNVLLLPKDLTIFYFHSLFLRILHKMFGFDWPSGFREDVSILWSYTCI